MLNVIRPLRFIKNNNRTIVRVILISPSTRIFIANINKLLKTMKSLTTGPYRQRIVFPVMVHLYFSIPLHQHINITSGIHKTKQYA